MEAPYYSENDSISHNPMTPQAEAALYTAFLAGDLSARNALIENNLLYATAVANRHITSRRYLQAEAISAANYGLVKAIESRKFNPATGRLTTYATKFIIGEICALFRVSSAVSFPPGKLPDWPDDWAAPAVNELDTFEHPAPFTPEQLDHERLHEAISALSDQRRQLIELLFFGGESMTSAALIMNVSRPWAHKLRENALNDLRIALGVMDQVELDEEDAIQEAA